MGEGRRNKKRVGGGGGISWNELNALPPFLLSFKDLEHNITEHPLWQEGPPITEEDLDIMREALEKHVTTKLYHWYFSFPSFSL